MRKFIPFFAATVILVVIFGTIYGVGQQVLRQSANDPQIQLAEDAADKLNAGASPQSLATSNSRFASSLAPFVNVYDRSGSLVAGSDGGLPAVPDGVLKTSDNRPYHIVTWQPRQDVRLASIVVSAHSYYVLAGRSLREVELRESKLSMITFVSGANSILIAFIGFWMVQRRHKLNKEKE